VLDITDPANPTLVGSYDTPRQASRVVVSGDLAFVADYHAGLHVLDITDPANPTLIGSYDVPDEARGLAVAGDHAFVSGGRQGFHVIRVLEHPWSRQAQAPPGDAPTSSGTEPPGE